jgi:hypothetical protein
MKDFFAVSITSPQEQTPFGGQPVQERGAAGIIYKLYAGDVPDSYWANWEADMSAQAPLQPLTDYIRPESPLIFGDAVLLEVQSKALCLSTCDSFFQDRANACIWVNFSRYYWLYENASITRSSSLWLAETPISDPADARLQTQPVTIGGKNVYFRIRNLSIPSRSENEQLEDRKGRIAFEILNLDGLFSAFPFYGALLEIFFYRGAREPDDLGQYTKLKEGVCRSYNKSAAQVHVSAEILAQALRFLINLPKAADLFPATFTDALLAVPMALQNGDSVVPLIAGYRFISQKPIYSSGKVQVDVGAKPDNQFSYTLVSIEGTAVVCLQQYLEEEGALYIQRDYFLKPTGAGSGNGASATFIGAIGAGLWLGAAGEKYTGGILAIESLAYDSYASTLYEFLDFVLKTYSNFPFASALWDASDNNWIRGKVYPVSFTLDKSMSFNELISTFKIFQLMIVQKQNGKLALRSKLYPPQTVRGVYLKRPPDELLEEPEIYSSLAVTFQSINTDNFRTSKTAFSRDASQAATASSVYHIVSELAIEIPIPISQFQLALNALERVYQQPRRKFICECLADYAGVNDILDIELYDLVKVNLDEPVDAGFGGETTLICVEIDYYAKTMTLEEIL